MCENTVLILEPTGYVTDDNLHTKPTGFKEIAVKCGSLDWCGRVVECDECAADPWGQLRDIERI